MSKSVGSAFIKELQDRGFLYQCTADFDLLATAINNTDNPAGYIGFDCTAKSLHIGNLMQIMILRLMQKYGIKPVILVGGGTTKIGDPSDKDQLRKVLSDSEIQDNLNGIRQSLEKFLDFSSPAAGAIMVNNADWLDELNYITFLRDYGKHFSINRMVGFERIKKRLEEGQNLTFLEFNYMILQAYDFMHLNKNYNCMIQCGGSDQWGNIVSGVDLVRRVNGKEVFGMTTHLITSANGTKMGKTADGAMWLNANMLSPFDFYQFWRNVDDRDVFRFMKLYTDLPLSKIEEFENDRATNINEFKKILAQEVTALCHGHDIASQVQQQAIAIFEQGNLAETPEFHVNHQLIEPGVLISDLFRISGLTQSNGEAKRLIRDGGARINSHKISDENLTISIPDFQDGFIILSSGKKKHLKVCLK